MTDTQKNAAVEALKPCPFCGGADVELRESVSDACVACNECGCRTGLVYLGADIASNAYRKREVIAAWNERAAMPLPATKQSLAGEAVAWMYSHPNDPFPPSVRINRHDSADYSAMKRQGWSETPLYATPQPAPVTGGEDAGVSELYAMLAAAFNEEARLRYVLLKIADGVEKRAHDGSTFIDDHPDAMEIARAALSPSAPEAPSEQEKVEAEALGWAKATAWHKHGIAWDHLEQISREELLADARARKIGGAS